MINKKHLEKNFTQTFFSLFSLSWVLISSPHFLPRPHHHHLHLHFLRRCWPRNRQPSFSEKDQKTIIKWGKTDKKQTREIKATGQTIEVYSWNNVVWILQLFEDYFPFVRRNMILCFFWFFSNGMKSRSSETNYHLTAKSMWWKLNGITCDREFCEWLKSLENELRDIRTYKRFSFPW